MLRFSWAQLDAKRDIVIQVVYAAHGRATVQPSSIGLSVRARLLAFTAARCDCAAVHRYWLTNPKPSMARRALSRGAARALGTKAPSFKPQLADVNTSRLAAFSDRLIGCAGPRGYDRRHYERLHARSVSEPRQFWRAVFDAVRLPGSLGPRERDARGAVPWNEEGPPGAVDWFPDAAVNHAELLLEGPHKPDQNLALLS